MGVGIRTVAPFMGRAFIFFALYAGSTDQRGKFRCLAGIYLYGIVVVALFLRCD